MLETETTTNDAVLDAEQTEEVTAFLAESIKEFLEENYEESEHFSERGIEMDLCDHGRAYAIGQIYEFAQSHPVDATAPPVMPWLKLLIEEKEDAFENLLDELYDEALDRVSWKIGFVVSVEEKKH